MPDDAIRERVMLADLHDAASILRQRASRLRYEERPTHEAVARADALRRIADWIEAEALRNA